MKVAQAAVQSQQEINGRIIVQPSSLGGFKIHLSEGSRLGSSTSESLCRTRFLHFSELCLRCTGRWAPSPTSCYIFSVLAVLRGQLSLPSPSTSCLIDKEKRQTPTNCTSLQADPPSPRLTPQTTLCPILLLAASRPGFLGQHCLCLPRQCSLQRQKKGQMAGPLGSDPTSCVLVFQDKLSGVASLQSPSFFSPNPISEPEEGALPASRRSLLPRESQTWEAAIGPHCLCPGPTAKARASWLEMQKGPVLIPSAQSGGKKPGLLPLSSPPEPRALWMSGFSDMKNRSPVKQVFLLDKDRI